MKTMSKSFLASWLVLTGLALSASMQTAVAQAPGASGVDFSLLAVRLKDIAAGNTSGPNYMAPVDQRIAETMAKQSAKMARSAAQAGIDAAMSGGMSLSGSAYGLAMQGAGNAMLAGQLAGARAQASADVARAEAQRQAEQLVPDSDRPLEAQAVLSILEGQAGNSVAWQNPATGASGKVTFKPVDKRKFGGLDCRMFLREWRSGGTVRKGDMLACRNRGEWYDFS
jgi:surface antigen